jgi:hypothetical protein
VEVLGWVVLALVFVDELLAVAAAAVWGYHEAGVWFAVVMSAVVVAAWWLFASPKAPLGGPVTRPVTKVLVFGLASLGLWTVGHHGWAVALVAFSVVVNGLAQLPAIRALAEESPGVRATSGRRPRSAPPSP